LNKANVVSIGFLLPVVQGFAAALIATFIVVAMLAVSLSVALICAATLLAIYGLLLLATRGPMMRASSTAALSWRKRTQLAQESVGGIRDVILDRTALHFQSLYEETEHRLRDAQLTSNFLAAAPRFLVEAFGFLVMISVALWLFLDGHATESIIPTLGAIAVGAQRLLPLLQQSYSAFAGFAANRQSIRDLAALLQERPSSARHSQTGTLTFNQTIRFEQVSFYYQGNAKPVLGHVSLIIRKGERVGLFGPSGGGKSTFMDLLLGLQLPSSGRVLIDGDALIPANLASWHQRVAHVPQNVFLADCSIAENIAFGMPRSQIDVPRLIEAAKAARVTEFSDLLPDELWTTVGERGATLSGGQRQRIGIARALYKRAELLVLDEITSALDQETEQEIVATIRDLPADRTVVIIAHRLSTLAHCDRLFELRDGSLHSENSDETTTETS
jgi:ABC-type bacteriocin/lantibiotic exporter with double-glycine peptidase domain